MSVVCKLFIRSRTESPDGTFTYDLGAVCRGETNKDWAAATPSGTLKHGPHPMLEEVWADKLAGKIINPEVLVYVMPHPDGAWVFDKCAFSYGGCGVEFRQKGQPWGSLSLTINASGATKEMRKAFAESLTIGEPAKFAVEITVAETEV